MGPEVSNGKAPKIVKINKNLEVMETSDQSEGPPIIIQRSDSTPHKTGSTPMKTGPTPQKNCEYSHEHSEKCEYSHHYSENWTSYPSENCEYTRPTPPSSPIIIW